MKMKAKKNSLSVDILVSMLSPVGSVILMSVVVISSMLVVKSMILSIRVASKVVAKKIDAPENNHNN